MKRTLQNVLDELRDEQHVPMVALVEELTQQEWAIGPWYELSMLRLWIARRDAATAGLLVVYADGRGGGRPSPPYKDAFELTALGGSSEGERITGSRAATIEAIREWFEAAQRSGRPAP